VRKREAMHAQQVAAQRPDLLPIIRAPQFGEPVLTAGRESLPVRANGRVLESGIPASTGTARGYAARTALTSRESWRT
jgi:hypothetical protein